MKTHHTKYDYEIFFNPQFQGKIREKISILELNQKELTYLKSHKIYLKSTLFILVLRGNGTFSINYKKHRYEKRNMILLSFGHFFSIDYLSEDFSCISLYIGEEYIEEMYTTDMFYKRVKYAVKMYKNPILSLTESEATLLKKRIHFIVEIIDIEQHHHIKEMILNSLRIFFLDLSNIIENIYQENSFSPPSREENYFVEFLNLLVHHYKKEHLVDFYAQKISISSHYLIQIVKKLTGQTVSDFISHLLYSDARQLLSQPKLSIQQIAHDLHFSDQSAFGKFFKRKSGLSPLQFKKLNINN